MGASWKYYVVTILFLFYSFGIDSGNADICYDDYDNFEKACPDSVFSPSETYCCGTPGLHYCCDYDDYELYNESIGTAIIIVIVIVVVFVVGTVGGIIACCVCGCLCCARSRPVTRTYVTTQPVIQGQTTVIQQPGYYTPPGAAYPPPPVAYPSGGEKVPNYPV